MDNNISLDLYKIFCVVVRTGNMSAAAKELFISQPAVSMSIHQLEERIGSPLLIRTSKGVRTTPEGAVLYQYLDKALDLIHTAETKYKQMVNMELGELRISAGDRIITNYLLPYLKRYTRLYPEITIKLFNNPTIESLSLLRKGEIDICFVNIPLYDEDSEFDIKECLKIHGCVIGGSRYKKLAESGITLKELSSYQLILLDKRSNTRHFIDDAALSYGIHLEPTMELANSELVMELVKANMGTTITFREFIDIDNKEIFEIPCTPPAPERAIGLATVKNVKLSTAAEKFVELLKLN